MAEFPQTLAEWAAEPNRLHANCCTSPAVEGRGSVPQPRGVGGDRTGPATQVLVHQPRRCEAARAPVRAARHQAASTRRVTFTPGLQSYNEVNSWFAEGMAEAGYVVLIIDPQGQGDSENCGHTPDGTQTTCPTTNQPNDTRSAIDFMLSTPSQPVSLGTRHQRRRVPRRSTRSGRAIDRDPRHRRAFARRDRGHADRPGGRSRRRRHLLRQPRPTLLDGSTPRRTPTLTSAPTTPFPRPARRRRRHPTPTQHVGAFDQLAPPAWTRCRSRPAPATTTSSATSPTRRTSPRAATASGSRSTTRWRGSTGT